MNINVLFKVTDFIDPVSVKIAENLSKEAYLKHVGMIVDTLVSTLHKPVNVSYSTDELTCTIELSNSISFNKYKVLKFYLKRIDLLDDIKLAFNATDAFAFNGKRFFYIFQKDKEYVAVILQGYKLRNVIRALMLVKNNNKVTAVTTNSSAIWPGVLEVLETYYHLSKDLDK